MEGTLGCIAQHMVGSLANGRVSSELQDAWKEFLHPDYAWYSPLPQHEVGGESLRAWKYLCVRRGLGGSGGVTVEALKF